MSSEMVRWGGLAGVGAGLMFLLSVILTLIAPPQMVVGYLNAWCELSGRKLSGRCPRFRVGLLPDPEGKGTGLSWSTWTPSSPHFTL
jgi:hypothetical protein